MEHLQPLYDWLHDESNYKVIRLAIALLSIPGAIWGGHLFFLWLRNRGIDRRVEDINETLQRIQDTLDGAGIYKKQPSPPPVEADIPKSAQASESASARDERIGKAFTLLQLGKPERAGASPSSWADYILVTMYRQREAVRADGKKETLEDMLGTPENPTHFRNVIMDLFTASMGEQEVILRCQLAPGHGALRGLEAAIKGGALLLAKQEPYWRLKYKSIPKFKAEGIRRD